MIIKLKIFFTQLLKGIVKMSDSEKLIESTINNLIYPEVTRLRKSHSEFISDLIHGANNVRKLLIIICSFIIKGDRAEDEKAILMGYMVYLYKLYDSSIYLINDGRSEIASVLLRTLTETAIKLKFLIGNINAEVCEKIKKSSLAYDKKLWDEIEKRQNGSAPTPIELRMKDSIQEGFELAGYKLGQIDFKRDKNWCEDSFNLASKVDLMDLYEIIFRQTSSAVHASWGFHQKYNLKTIEERYEPELNYAGAKPQPIEGASGLVLILSLDYLSLFKQDSFLALFASEIGRAQEWFHNMSYQHEEFLQKNQTKSRKI